MKKLPIEIQTDYYKSTADKYDEMHVCNSLDFEHDFALHFLCSLIELYSINSILDVGAGTGRVIMYLKKKFPHLTVIGIEPVLALRTVAYEKGISDQILIEGNGTAINFNDDFFDIVCEFGVLHHIEKPECMIKEMIRISRKGIFISDTNNFGQGSKMSRIVKQIIASLNLWKTFNFIRTKGKMYHLSANDGLYYSYSIFDSFKLIKKFCSNIHILNTSSGGRNIYQTASHVALFALKNH